MLEENKERLSKTEYDKIGDMLLELIKECPYIPKGSDIRYNSKTTGKCVSIFTTGGNVKKKNVLGGFTAELGLQIAYQSFPVDNTTTIDAQAALDSIANWFKDIDNLPKLTGNRTITYFSASPSFSTVEEVGKNKATLFITNVVMEYEVD